MNNYYLCAWAHVVLWSERSNDAISAGKHCFGSLRYITVLDVGTKSPTHFSKSKRIACYEELRKLHAEQTGNNLLPAHELTMVPRRQLTSCICGSGKDSWMVYTIYRNTPLCRVCIECLPSREDWLFTRRYL